MKRKKQNQVDMGDKNDEEPSSCETRRRIEDLHEMRRYQDELGLVDEALDLI